MSTTTKGGAKKAGVEMQTQPTRATSVHEMLAYSQGQLVTLPPFGEGMPCIVRLKRLSIMGLVKSGKIPNQLLANATELFNTGKIVDEKKIGQDDFLQRTSEMLSLIAESALVEPTYKELEDAGVELTDLQLGAIFAYSQSGVKDLERFPNV